MTKYVLYVIEKERRSYVLRRFGRSETLASGPDAASVREQAFDRLRGHAPCLFQILGSAPEEWRIESDKSAWKRHGEAPPRDQ